MVVHSSTLRQISMPLATVMPIIGAIAITLATQVRLDLPFTPVPVTGQTSSLGLVRGLWQRPPTSLLVH
jgi:biotin transporter BioY